MIIFKTTLTNQLLLRHNLKMIKFCIFAEHNVK